MIETEKKYKISSTDIPSIEQYLEKIGADRITQYTEINTLYSSPILKPDAMIRVRAYRDDVLYGNHRDSTITYKEKISQVNGLNKQKEIEFTGNHKKMVDFIESLGFIPTLIYEKKRYDWYYSNDAVISIDVLPFGTYIEIEGEEPIVNSLEIVLKLANNVEERSYPTLTKLFGTFENGLPVAKF